MAGRLRTLVVGAVLATLAVVPAAQPAFSTTTAAADRHGSSCAADLDRTLDRFTTTLLARDLEGYMRLWDDDAVLILNSGEVRTGKAAIREFYVGFFGLEGWTETFDGVSRQIFNCQTAYTVDNVLFEIPESGVRSPLVVSLTLTRENGRWVVVGEHITGVSE